MIKKIATSEQLTKQGLGNFSATMHVIPNAINWRKDKKIEYSSILKQKKMQPKTEFIYVIAISLTILSIFVSMTNPLPKREIRKSKLSGTVMPSRDAFWNSSFDNEWEVDFVDSDKVCLRFHN